MRDYGFNNKMASWWCGKNVEYNLCDDYANDNCMDGNGLSGAGNARSPSVDEKKNHMTTVFMKPYDANKVGAVMLFNDKDCRSKVGKLYASEDLDER